MVRGSGLYSILNDTLIDGQTDRQIHTNTHLYNSAIFQLYCSNNEKEWKAITVYDHPVHLAT